MDNFEYELPSDFEDEEIDEEAAFNEEDKKLYSDWFGDKDDRQQHPGRHGDEAGLLNSEVEGEACANEEQYNTDDFSEPEVRIWPLWTACNRDQP